MHENRLISPETKHRLIMEEMASARARAEIHKTRQDKNFQEHIIHELRALNREMAGIRIALEKLIEK